MQALVGVFYSISLALPIWYFFEIPRLERDPILQVSHANVNVQGDHLRLNATTKQSCEFDRNCKAYSSRLDQYCHRSLLHFNTSEAAEGAVRSRDLELVQVFITARHGDRSPATPYSSFKIGSPVSYQCGLVDRITPWEGLKDFMKLSSLSSKAKNGHIGLFPGTGSRQCGVGMLTQVGFQQHCALGSLIQEKYASFIGQESQDMNPDQLYVQSTDVPRTIHSAAAFLLGFLSNTSKLRYKVPIHVSPGTILQLPPPGIKQTYGSCKKLPKVMLEDQENTNYLSEEREKFHHMVLKLCNMFSLPKAYRSKPMINELFDHILTRGCHSPGSPLPCNTKKECISYSFANDLFAFADWTWGRKYPQASSILAMLPFLRHTVLELMERVVTGLEDQYKFVLSFTHDTTLTQVLNALGIPLEGWMPYASRLVFELWRHKSQDAYFVRVLFNGRPITEALSLHPTSSRTPLEVDNQLLLFSSWTSLITTGKYRDISSYNTMCGNQ